MKREIFTPEKRAQSRQVKWEKRWKCVSDETWWESLIFYFVHAAPTYAVLGMISWQRSIAPDKGKFKSTKTNVVSRVVIRCKEREENVQVERIKKSDMSEQFVNFSSFVRFFLQVAHNCEANSQQLEDFETSAENLSWQFVVFHAKVACIIRKLM